MESYPFYNPVLTNSLEWKHSPKPVAYEEALQLMEERVVAIQKEKAPELVWFLEHPPLYTLGTRGKSQDVLRSDLPIYQTGRGGQVTYHGPGQRVVYLLLDLRHRCKDVRAYVSTLESWLLNVLSHFEIKAFHRPGRIGLWVSTSENKEEKIAAIGVRISKWVTSHGISLNVHPTLEHFKGIVPCGLNTYGVTSLQALGKNLTLKEVDKILTYQFKKFF